VNGSEMKVIGRDRNGNPVLKIGRQKFLYRRQEADGKHSFATRLRGLRSAQGNYEMEIVRVPEEDFESFKTVMDDAQLVREGKRASQQAARNISTGFKRTLRASLRGYMKSLGPLPSYSYERFQKLRLEVFEQHKMRISLTGNQTLKFSFDFTTVPKEDAVRWTMRVLDPLVNPKSFDDFEIVDADAPENSARLRNIALKNICIITGMHTVGVRTVGNTPDEGGYHET
jgi:hypothetical protein